MGRVIEMDVKTKLIKILSDPVLWTQNFAKIVNKEGKLVPFRFNPQQKELVRGLSKYNIILKSRQLGITSVSCALSLYYALTENNVHCMLISYSFDSCSTIFDKLKQIYESLPQVIRSEEIANNRTSLKFANGSKITVTTLGSKEVGRGSSLKYVHLSELAFAKQERVSKALLAIEQALLPNGKIVIESTANGLNEFYEMWSKAESHESLYKPFFFSWIDDKLMFAHEYKDFAKRYKKIYGHSLEADELDSKEQDYYKMGASLEQLMWRRLKIANSDEQQFRQEFPAEPIEAFVTSGNNVFNVEKVAKQAIERKNAERQINIKDIPEILRPFLKTYFYVYEKPIRSMRYYVGVDSSEGLGMDFSVVTVLDKDGRECAQFRSNQTQAYELAEIVNAIGLYYNRALIVVEKASTGGVILDRLRNTFHYKNLYKHRDYDERGKVVKRIGWKTTNKSKPILINDLVEWFDNDDIFIRSQSTFNEMKVYLYDGTSTNARQGSHDDTIISLALAVQGIKSGINYLW